MLTHQKMAKALCWAQVAMAPEGLWLGRGVSRNIHSRLPAEDAEHPQCPALSCEITEVRGHGPVKFRRHFCSPFPRAQAGDQCSLKRASRKNGLKCEKAEWKEQDIKLYTWFNPDFVKKKWIFPNMHRNASVKEIYQNVVLDVFFIPVGQIVYNEHKVLL